MLEVIAIPVLLHCMEITPSEVNLGNVSSVALTEKANAFVSAMRDSKGQFVTLSFKSTPNPSASFKGTVLEKITTGVFRTGVSFANLNAVKTAIENGERGDVGSLLAGQSWAVYPFVIVNRDGSQLLRLTVAVGQIPTVSFKVNGLEVSREEYESYLTPSARVKPSTPVLVFNIKESNLISIG